MNLVNYLPPPTALNSEGPRIFQRFPFFFSFVFFFFLVNISVFHCAVFRVVVFAPVTTGDADCWRWPSPEIVPRVTSRPVRSPTRASCSSFKKITRRLFSISLPRFSFRSKPLVSPGHYSIASGQNKHKQTNQPTAMRLLGNHFGLSVVSSARPNEWPNSWPFHFR